MEHNSSSVRKVSAFLFMALCLGAGSHAMAQSSELAPGISPIRVDIAIEAREFKPSPVSVAVGEPVVLVFTNNDVELHAFVPERFLEHEPVHIDGNGAPQFGEKGLERVLIPSGGTEEIRFLPTQVGGFDYRCDLPGHQMVGKIVVENRQTDQHTAVERRTGVQGTP